MVLYYNTHLAEHDNAVSFSIIVSATVSLHRVTGSMVTRPSTYGTTSN